MAKKPVKKGGMNQFASQMVTALLIFLFIIFAFRAYQDYTKNDIKEVSIAEVATLIKNKEVDKIVVEGDKLTVTLIDETEVISQKEKEVALSETFSIYGLTSQQIGEAKIVSKEPSGIGVWLLPLLSIFAPILFILFLFWILSRQVKGSTMQAFSFGQSKARVIDPNDKNQKVTFKDVAGAREAKEELTEVVEFLRILARVFQKECF